MKFVHQQTHFKITLTCSYMFPSTTIIRQPSLEPS